MTRRWTGLMMLGLTVACLARVSLAQVVNPADKQQAPDAAPTASADAQKAANGMHTWEIEPIDVYGKAPLTEEDLIGTYRQPRWTAHRRFGETRVYVVPKGMAEFEYWLIPERLRDGSTTIASQYELEFGLPGRLQLDLYAVTDQAGNNGRLRLDQQKVEVRYALADWGKIFGNPTVYLEWKGISEAQDHLEAKLLLGGQVGSGWHWGSNFVFEHEMGGAMENSNEWTTGISRTVRDTRLSIGTETQLALVNQKINGTTRGAFHNEFLIGPSIQYRPLPQMHLDFAPLFGTTSNSSRMKLFVVLGWEF